jgi:hypothetical protein
MMKLPIPILAATLGMTLSACGGEQLAAPSDRNACYRMAQIEGEEIRFNLVAEDLQSIEFCAAELEKARMELVRSGVGGDTISGTYNGQFLFIDRRGVFTAQRYDGVRYMLLVRYPGGFIVPGAIPPEVSGAGT